MVHVQERIPNDDFEETFDVITERPNDLLVRLVVNSCSGHDVCGKVVR